MPYQDCHGDVNDATYWSKESGTQDTKDQERHFL